MSSTESDSRLDPIAQWWDSYDRERRQAESHRLLVFVRSLRPAPGAHEQRAQIFDALEMACDEELIDRYDTRLLGDELCFCQHCQEVPLGESVRSDVRRLSTWEEGEVCSAGFHERQVECTFTDEAYPVLVPPETTIAIRVDGSLAGVFPCVVGGTHYSVETLLTNLLANSRSEEAPSRTDEVSTDLAGSHRSQ